ncbi:MAG: hypothetical protein ACRDRK_14915 [Pseudonocardia sp.]
MTGQTNDQAPADGWLAEFVVTGDGVGRACWPVLRGTHTSGTRSQGRPDTGDL